MSIRKVLVEPADPELARVLATCFVTGLIYVILDVFITHSAWSYALASIAVTFIAGIAVRTTVKWAQIRQTAGARELAVSGSGSRSLPRYDWRDLTLEVWACVICLVFVLVVVVSAFVPPAP